MKNTVVAKINGKIWLKDISPEEVESKEFSKEMHLSNNHLCSNCDNCYADKCLKVFDEVKKPIEKYDFISDGVQVYDDMGDTKFFYVNGCSNYKADKVRHKPSTKEELNRLKMLKESIKILYFDAETIEEADQTQLDLLRRRQISFDGFESTGINRK